MFQIFVPFLSVEMLTYIFLVFIFRLSSFQALKALRLTVLVLQLIFFDQKRTNLMIVLLYK